MLLSGTPKWKAKGIEGNPFITRFKIITHEMIKNQEEGIEGNPFITRFKTDR